MAESKKSLFNDSIQVRDPAQQKRKRARTNVNFEAEFAVAGGGTLSPCVLTDVGTGGLSFTTRAGLYKGDRIEVHFVVGGKKVVIPGEVVRVAGKTVAMEYRDAGNEALDAVQNFIHAAFFEKDRKKP